MNKFNNSIGSILIKVNGSIDFKLQKILDKNGITKYKLSRVTGIRYDTICNYCKGNVTLINVEYLKIFCNILHCKIDDLIEYKEN